MRNVIAVGCDLHDKTMLLMIGMPKDSTLKESVVKQVWSNHREARGRMIEDLKGRATAVADASGVAADEVKIVLAYGTTTVPHRPPPCAARGLLKKTLFRKGVFKQRVFNAGAPP